jgi:dihydroorotate dehydrogenase electron transfer subunit
MTQPSAVHPAVACEGVVHANHAVSSGLLRIDADLDTEVGFSPGQFAMLNFTGGKTLVFSRPFSIYAAQGRRVSFLYRIVGRGTALMADLKPGDPLSFLGPLGRPFAAPDPDVPAVLIAGGVGLPPLAAWQERYGRPGDRAFFGARDPADVPWDLLDNDWHVSVDRMDAVPAGREAWEGLVTDLVARREGTADSNPRVVLSCGPLPLLKAASRLAADRGWDCWLSLEEHMGCGYGVCKGCVVPVHDPAAAPDRWRNATSCQEGPVFNARDIAWERHPSETVPSLPGTERG